jgi:MFS family permease
LSSPSATWILDGLEVTLAGALGGILTRPDTLGLTPVEVGASATYYLAGAVIGALLFGYGADRFGRKKLFFITVAVYLFGTALSAFSWNFASYAIFRALTGAGIGGEYAAINSAIDELIPARVRGRVDLMINGSYWVGAALGAIGTLILLDPERLPVWLDWRLSPAIRDWQCAWTDRARAPLRHDRPQEDDCHHLCAGRTFVGANGMALLRGAAHRPDADAGMVDHFLHSLRCR